MHPAPIPRAAEASDRTKGLLRLTMACNERCPFCNVPVEDHPAETRTSSPAEVDAQLRAFVAAGEKTLTISGGEPTLLRARLVALVAEARHRGIEYVELQTNAVLIDEPYARELARAGLTSAFVSLLSHVPALHDELAGLEGAFERCLAGIDALVEHGVRVTLNPVIARTTQALVPEYVDFVAARLPAVESISLSAVQPHGRAAKNLDLLPDYAVLGPAVREARARAERHGIRLLNPYCGLPACVGWEEALDRSVEAIEAEQAHGATFGGVPGLDNRGDKRHGPPCLACALRTRCGGAWHAYWSHRAGSGIAAPIQRREPWDPDVDAAPGHLVVRASVVAEVGDDLRCSRAPTRWLVLRELGPGDGARVLASGASDLALDGSARGLLARPASLRELRTIAAAQAGRPPQARLRIAARLLADAGHGGTYRAVRALAEAGADAIRLELPPDAGEHARARWSKVRDALALELPGLALRIGARGPG